MSTQTEERTDEKTEETHNDPRHIFCGVCAAKAGTVGTPRVALAFCGEVALSEGRSINRYGLPPNPCPTCLAVSASRLFGCDACTR